MTCVSSSELCVIKQSIYNRQYDSIPRDSVLMTRVLVTLLLLQFWVLGTHATCDPSCTGGEFCDTGVCTDCPTGSRCAGGVRTECEAGTFQNERGRDNCVLCPRGTYQTVSGQSTCTNCEKGKFEGGTGQSSACSDCLAGTFSDFTGATACAQCLMNTFQPEAGRQECANCAAGYRGLDLPEVTGATESSQVCGPCDAGEYKPSAGPQQCTKCEEDFYQEGTGATSCVKCGDDQYYDATGATSAFDCLCIDGLESDGETCVPCPTCLVGEYIDIAQGGSCLDNNDRQCRACSTCGDGQYIPYEKVCDGNGNNDRQQNCFNWECGTQCREGQLQMNRCNGKGTVDVTVCVNQTKYADGSLQQCPVDSYGTDAFISVIQPGGAFPDSVGQYRVFINPQGTFYASMLVDKRGTTNQPGFGVFSISDSGQFTDPTHGNALAPAGWHNELDKTLVHGFWSFNGTQFFAVRKDGSIAKVAQQSGVGWVLEAQWSTWVGPGTLADSQYTVVECVSVPYDTTTRPTGANLQGAAVCSFDLLKNNGDENAVLVQIDENGGQSAPKYEQLDPQRENAGLFYDHWHNVLYWSLHKGTHGNGPFLVLEVLLSSTYSLWVPPYVRLFRDELTETLLKSGVRIQGAAIDPRSDRGDLYFYNYIHTTIMVPKPPLGELGPSALNFLSLHKWGSDRTQDPPPSIDPTDITGFEAALDHTVADVSMQLTITHRGTWYLYKPLSNRLYKANDCTECPTGKRSASGSTSLSDCVCPEGSFDNGGTCQRHRDSCDPGKYISAEGTPTSDSVCSPCNPCDISDGISRYINPENGGCTKLQNTVLTECLVCDCNAENSGIGSSLAGYYISNANACRPNRKTNVAAGDCSACANCGLLEHIVADQACPGSKRVDDRQCGTCGENCALRGNPTYITGCNGDTTSPDGTCEDCTSCTQPGEGNVGTPCDGTGTSDTHSCGACASCLEGQFRGPAGDCVNPDCQPCTACTQVGYYLAAPCTGRNSVQDKQCLPCSDCDPDQFINGVCPAGSVTDVRTCGNCSDCDPGQYISVPCDGKAYDGVTGRKCASCFNCDPGWYVAAPCDGTSKSGDARGCLPCEACGDGQYMLGCQDGSGSTKDNGGCADCESCPEGQYAQNPCNGSQTSGALEDRQCEDCADCPVGHYISAKCPAGSTDPLARNCTACPACPEGYYMIGCNGNGFTDNSQCIPCELCQDANHYVSRPCDGSGRDPNDRECAACFCPAKQFITELCTGGLNNPGCSGGGTPPPPSTTPAQTPAPPAPTTTTPAPPPPSSTPIVNVAPPPSTTPEPEGGQGPLSLGMIVGVVVIILIGVGGCVGYSFQVRGSGSQGSGASSSTGENGGKKSTNKKKKSESSKKKKKKKLDTKEMFPNDIESVGVLQAHVPPIYMQGKPPAAGKPSLDELFKIPA